MMPSVFRSETNLRSAITLVAVIGLPVLIALVTLAKFSGLIDATALNHAQLARHIAAGHGYVTGALQPLPQTVSVAGQTPPDLITAPVHPALLGGVFRLTGANDKVVAITGLVLWLLSLWLVFWIARRWWDWRAAGLAVLFCVSSLAGLMVAAGGLPQPLMALLVFSAVAMVFPQTDSVTKADLPLALWRAIAAGAFCGLATLTDYRLVPLVIVLGIFLFQTQPRRVLVLMLFASGVLLLLIPWGIRNLMVSGRVLGLYWYGALENTRQFPGESIWQLTNIPKHPLLTLLVHPLELLRKLVLGLAQYQQEGLGMVTPVALFLCVVALVGAPAQSSRRRLAAIACSSAVLSILFSCLTQPDGRLLLAWTPMLGCVAAAQSVVWVQAHVSGFSLAKTRLQLNALVMRSLTYAGIVTLTVFPAVMRFGNANLGRQMDPVAIRAAIDRRIPTNGVVLTDAPAYVAWYLNRPALRLCQRESDLAELEKRTGKIGGVYLSPALLQLIQPERGDWLIWLASLRGVYHGLELVPSNLLPGLLRLPQNMPAQLTAELELERLDGLQKSLREDPQSAEAQTQLAFTYLKLGRLREAQHIFQEVSRLDKHNVEALVGLWETLAQLNYADGTLRLARLTKQLAPNDPHAKTFLEEAAAHFEQIFALRPNDPWLLLNLIACREQLGQWKEVEGYSMRLSKTLPETFPPQLLLASLHLKQWDLAKAATECEQLLQDHPALPAAHELAGRVWLAQNKPEEALKEFEITTQLRPQWVRAQVEAAQVSQQLQRYDATAKHLELALKSLPDSVYIKVNLAEIESMQGKTAAAINIYRKILATNGKQPAVLNNLAVLLSKTGQAEEALPLARQAVIISPQNPDFRDTAGWAAFLTGNQNEALQHLLEAVRIAPHQGLTHFHLGKVLLAQHQQVEARQAFKHALECGLPEVEKQEAQTAVTGG